MLHHNNILFQRVLCLFVWFLFVFFVLALLYKWRDKNRPSSSWKLSQSIHIPCAEVSLGRTQNPKVLFRYDKNITSGFIQEHILKDNIRLGDSNTKKFLEINQLGSSLCYLLDSHFTSCTLILFLFPITVY